MADNPCIGLLVENSEAWNEESTEHKLIFRLLASDDRQTEYQNASAEGSGWGIEGGGNYSQFRESVRERFGIDLDTADRSSAASKLTISLPLAARQIYFECVKATMPLPKPVDGLTIDVHWQTDSLVTLMVLWKPQSADQESEQVVETSFLLGGRVISDVGVPVGNLLKSGDVVFRNYIAIERDSVVGGVRPPVIASLTLRDVGVTAKVECPPVKASSGPFHQRVCTECYYWIEAMINEANCVLAVQPWTAGATSGQFALSNMRSGAALVVPHRTFNATERQLFDYVPISKAMPVWLRFTDHDPYVVGEPKLHVVYAAKEMATTKWLIQPLDDTAEVTVDAPMLVCTEDGEKYWHVLPGSGSVGLTTNREMATRFRFGCSGDCPGAS